MEKDLFRLERLLETSAKLPAIRRDRKNKLSKKSWVVVRESAQSLFTALTNRWHCTCPSAHSALLRLDVVDTSNSAQANVHFDVLVSKSTTSSNQTVARPTWCNLRVESVENTKQSYVHFTEVLAFTYSARRNALTLKSLSSNIQTSKVTFQVTSAEDLGLHQKSYSQPIISSPSISSITDLCSALHVKPSPMCLGYLEDTSWKHTISCVQPSAGSISPGITKIYDVLGKQNSSVTVVSSHSALSTRQK